MSKGVAVLLGTILLGAVASIVFLLADGPGGGSSSWISRGDAEDVEAAALREAGAASLAARENAKKPKTAEELAAERAAAAAPTFARGEGVFGTVTNGRGEPIANAVVKLMEGEKPSRQPWNAYGRWGRPDTEQFAEATTNEKGEFLVGPAPEETFLRIRADAEGYAATVRDLKRRGYRVDLVLDVGGRLVVETKDAEGNPIRDARVFHQSGAVMTEDATDEDGRVELTNLPTGSGRLLVSSPEHAAVMQENVGVSPERTETVTLVLGAPLLVQGTVTGTDGMTPLEGVEVKLDYYNMPWLKAAEPITTDESGAFEIEALSGLGQWISLQATAAEHAPHRQWVQLQDSGEGRMKLDVKLTEARAPVEGRVVDADSHAVAGATVTYASRGMVGDEPPQTTTDSDGSFELPAPPWATHPNQSIHVLATAPGKGVGSGYAKIRKPDEAGQPVAISLCGVGRVQGEVVDGAGNPLVGALVTLLLDYQEMRQSMRGGGNPSLRYSAIMNSKTTRLDAVTDTEGAFAMDDVPCAAFRVQAEYGLDRITEEEVLLVEHGATAERRVEFVEGSTIEGYVFDSEDQPVAGATVSASPAKNAARGRWSPGGSMSARSQADGRFVLHGASLSAYNISAYAAGYQSQTEQNVAAGTQDLTLRLKALGWIEGVVEMNGVGYRGTFTVRAVARKNSGRNAIPQPAFNNWRPGSSQSTFSPDDGHFVLRGLKSGEYDVTVTSPEGHIGAEAVRVAVIDGEGTEAGLSLVAGATVSGVVLKDATSLPIAKASINVRPQTGAAQAMPSVSTRTDADGRFVARGLGTGPYVIHVQPPSGIAFQEPIDIVAGESRVVELREEAAGAIDIAVVDQDGTPIANVRPSVQAIGGTMIWPNWQALQKEGVKFGRNTWNELLQTDDQGRNLRRHVPPGEYTVRATMNGYKPSEGVAVTVRSNQTAEVELVLEKTAGGASPGN